MYVCRRRDEERREKISKMNASFKPPSELYSEQPKQTESTKRLALYDSSSDSDDAESEAAKKRPGVLTVISPLTASLSSFSPPLLPLSPPLPISLPLFLLSPLVPLSLYLRPPFVPLSLSL